MSLRTRRFPRVVPPPKKGHGQYIFAYTHIRTRQVLYSLSRSLDSRASLKQLPDTGANNTPSHLRKDLWRPLYTLALPSAHPECLAQGLHAFKKLREYRKLHELCWKPPLSLSKPYSDADIEYEKEKLGDRGGSKKESVYDIIRKRKARLREKQVMDQKANSVADLAAVLLEQEEVGRKTKLKRVAELKVDRAAEVQEIRELAKLVGQGELDVLEAQIQALQARVDSAEADAVGMSKRKLGKELHALSTRRLRMHFAADAVAKVTGSEVRYSTVREPRSRDVKPAAKRAQMGGDRILHRLRTTQSEARSGALVKEEAALAELEARLAKASSHTEVAYLRERIVGRKLKLRRLQLAADAADTPESGSKAMAIAKEVEVKVAKHRVELASAEIVEARKSGGGARRVAAKNSLGAAQRRLEAARNLPVEEEVAETTEIPQATAAQAPAESTPAAPSTEQAEVETIAPVEHDWNALLPSFPPRDPAHLPKKGPLVDKLKRLSSPIYSTEGVRVMWQDVMDAEYAALWPEAVTHERMGWTGNTAPDPAKTAGGDEGEVRATGEAAEEEGDQGELRDSGEEGEEGLDGREIRTRGETGQEGEDEREIRARDEEVQKRRAEQETWAVGEVLAGRLSFKGAADAIGGYTMAMRNVIKGWAKVKREQRQVQRAAAEAKAPRRAADPEAWAVGEVLAERLSSKDAAYAIGANRKGMKKIIVRVEKERKAGGTLVDG
ncbi:hypothetical protein LTR53_002821 [Teratosphaeriaceae sp. CCFEE 6253]|nr:hypothetical protein LTR53_002821 [Teratosphaeriaceae sp. CCFEE 6253]